MVELAREIGWPEAAVRDLDDGVPVFPVDAEGQQLVDTARRAARAAGARSLLGGRIGYDEHTGGIVLVVTWSRRTIASERRTAALDAVAAAVRSADPGVPVLIRDDSTVAGVFLHRLIRIDSAEQPPQGPATWRDWVAALAFIAACAVFALTEMPWRLLGAALIGLTVLGSLVVAARRGVPVPGVPTEPGDTWSPGATLISLLVVAVPVFLMAVLLRRVL